MVCKYCGKVIITDTWEQGMTLCDSCEEDKQLIEEAFLEGGDDN